MRRLGFWPANGLGVAGLSLGLTWAFWHLLVDFRYNIDAMGAAWLLEFAIVYVATLTPYRMLMTWVYSNTQSLSLGHLHARELHRLAARPFPRDLPCAEPVLAIRLCARTLGHGGGGPARQCARPTEAGDVHPARRINKPPRECTMSEADQQNRPRLPAAVYDLAMRLGVKPTDRRSSVRLTQTGRMKRKLGVESWMAFTATQTISTRACEFDWRARAGPFGLFRRTTH